MSLRLTTFNHTCKPQRRYFCITNFFFFPSLRFNISFLSFLATLFFLLLFPLPSYRAYILAMTFICYMCYHMCKKPFSVVKVRTCSLLNNWSLTMQCIFAILLFVWSPFMHTYTQQIVLAPNCSHSSHPPKTHSQSLFSDNNTKDANGWAPFGKMPMIFFAILSCHRSSLYIVCVCVCVCCVWVCVLCVGVCVGVAVEADGDHCETELSIVDYSWLFSYAIAMFIR